MATVRVGTPDMGGALSAEDAYRASSSESSRRAVVEAADHAFFGEGVDVTDIAGLSPEMILALVQRRLRDFDTQLQTQTAEIEQNTATAKSLSKKLEGLLKLQQAMDTTAEHGGEVALDSAVSEYGIAATNADGTTMNVRQFLEAHGVEIGSDVATVSHDDRSFIRGSTLDSAIESIRSEVQRVNSGNEMRMMRMQSVTQQRSEIVSLGSNLLKSFHDTESAIVRNMV